MYEDFFGFDRRPFALTPDPEFLYWTEQHRRAYDLVCLALLRQAPICLITGEVGVGKTTLIQALLGEISQDCEVGLLSNVVGDSGDLLRWILTAFGRDSAIASHAEALRGVEAMLRETWRQGRRSVLIVDEAQNLTDHGVETLRLLTNLDVGKCNPLSLVVAGQPELRERLSGERFTAFRQRLGASFHLGPMTLDETIAYVRGRIEIAGGDPDVFEAGAIKSVHRRAGGVPRLTNLLCEICLVAAYGEDLKRIDAVFAEAALTEHLAFGGLGGLPAEECEREVAAQAEAVAARAAGPAAAAFRVFGSSRPASAVTPFARRPTPASPSLRVVGAEPDGPDEAPPREPLLLFRPPASPQPASAPADVPAVEPAAAASGRGIALRHLLGSAAGLGVAASVAALALILPASDTNGRTAPGLAAAVAPAAEMGLPTPTAAVADAPSSAAPDVATRETDVALGVRELRAAPADPAAADALYARALEEATTSPDGAALDYARAAARGHSRAAYYLAQMYETGDGVAYAPATAWNWYAVAAGEVAGAEQRLDELAAVATVEAPRVPQPIFAAAEDGVVELVWEGGGSFVVELAPRPDAAEEWVYRTPLTAARVVAPPDVAWWRVRAVGGAPSQWMPVAGSAY